MTHGHRNGAGEEGFRWRHNLRCTVDQDGQSRLYCLLDHCEHLVLPVDLANLQRFALQRVQELTEGEGGMSGQLKETQLILNPRSVMVASHDHQLVVGSLHDMSIAEGDHRVHALGQELRILPDELLRGICVQNHYQQTTVPVVGFGFCKRRDKFMLQGHYHKDIPSISVINCNKNKSVLKLT